MSEDRTVLIDDVTLNDGVSQRTGKPYQRTVVSWKGEDGSERSASAFGNGLYEHAAPLKDAKAILTLEQKGDYLNLLAIRPAPVDKEPPTPGTGEWIKGQEPPSKVRGMCALNASTTAGGLTDVLMRTQTSQQVTPELVRAAFDAMYDHVFFRNLRSCGIVEDEDFPF